MPPKRKRNAPVGANGLVSSMKLKSSGCWGWVSSEIRDVDDITLEHRMTASNLSMRNGNPLCQNKYAAGRQETPVLDASSPATHVNGELSEDIIIVSDADEPLCAKKACKRNPYCLNYLGQEMWEDEDAAWETFTEAAKFDEDPALLSREADVPVGLKNLGATCYANASLQVWFRFAAFRAGVYACEPPHNMPEEKYKESPVSQLQVTFAALQAGNQKVFNPTKLVESLQLRTSEQQDAQEFSKLFMTHLDAEFKKQNSESLKTLITNQFQGTQVYGTICQSCKYRSETRSGFLEIEVSFKNNAKLEDCIATSLLPETLSGENRYLCPGCRTLQNATRYTELQILPPVLHFSLMRFVYDLNTMERKKSKHSISFPRSLDMNKFLGSPEHRRHATSTARADNVYDLRGILLHKGASAYHGHYEAQVYDAQHESWFLFNDELVTKINGLGDKIPLKQGNHKEIAEEDEKVDHLDVRKKRNLAKKRRRIEDSDDGDDVVEVKKTTLPIRSESMITSKDAYMLIYAKRDSGPSSDGDHKEPTLFQQPEPPNRAMKAVQYFNDEYTAACDAYVHEEAALKAHFTDIRSKVRAIYSTWNSTPNMGCVVVSRQALESWISTHSIAANSKQSTTIELTDSDSLAEQNQISIACSDIICEHGFLDPKKSDDMKCITPDAYQRIVTDTNCKFSPALESSQVCAECVSVEFPERLYQIEHPRYVKLIDDVCNVAEGESGYWISKKWYKDWRLVKPKLHVASHEDPGPDSVEFYNHVYCEHGCLTLNSTNRRKMSTEAVDLLKTLFPQWEPLYSDVDPCAVCEAEISLSKEDKREVRRRVEDEKARLRFLLDSTLDMWKEDEGSCAVLSTQFVKNWRRWVSNPLEQQRPEKVDNTQFFCPHELLAIDLNYPSDLDSSIMIIQLDEWNILNSIYEGGPLITLSKKVIETGGYQQDMPVCQGCRNRRKSEWDTADIVIRHIDPNATSKNKPINTYGRSNGPRQSKRLRPVKEDGKRRHITVSKSTTVKDIKIMVQAEFSFPTICQRLFLRGQELEDNDATVESLQILANDTVDLREAEEIVDLTSDNDEPPKRKKKKEGDGFSGTLLGNADAPWSSSPEQTPCRTELVKECAKCTLSNPLEALSCEVCHAHFA